MDDKSQYKKLRISQHEPQQSQVWPQVFRKDCQFLNDNTTIGYFYLSLLIKAWYTKEIIKICKSYKTNQCNKQKKKDNKANNGRSNTAQKTLNNTNSTEKRGQTQMLWKDNHFLIITITLFSKTKFEDTKEIIRSLRRLNNAMVMRKKGQQDKQWSTKHCTER